MELIQITKNNYKEYNSIDVVAFSFAEGGAMGEPGGILIADSQGVWYHTNYAMGDFPYDCIKDIIPAFQECRFKLFGLEPNVPDDWFYEYLGMGNHLVVKEQHKEAFLKKAASIIGNPGKLYQGWREIINEIVAGLC